MRASILSLPLLFGAIHGAAAPLPMTVDENAMFGTDETVVAVSNLERTDLVSNRYPRLSVTGTAYATVGYGMQRWWELSNWQASSNRLSASMKVDLSLEARIAEGAKFFASGQLTYLPFTTNQTVIPAGLVFDPTGATSLTLTNPSGAVPTLKLQELFVDLTLANAVYMRFGKQVLAWGRGYFWNPSDLVNIERRSLVDRDASREGAWGWRVHVPVGTVFNAYSFVNVGAQNDWNAWNWSLKTEFLLGPLEVSLSTLLRPSKWAVFGADASVGIGGWNFTAEGVLSQEGWESRIGTNQYGTPRQFVASNWTGRFSASVNRSFDQNRTTILGEVYFNAEGWEGAPLTVTNLRLLAQNGIGFRPLDMAKWYAALTFSRGELFNKTTSVSVTAVANLNDVSAMVLPSVAVEPFPYFTVTFRCPFYLGAPEREFTLAKSAFEPSLEARYRF